MIGLDEDFDFDNREMGLTSAWRSASLLGLGGREVNLVLIIRILTFEMMTMKRRRVKRRLEMTMKSHRGAGSLAKVEEQES